MKVKINRQQLVKPEMNTLNVMLGTLNLVRTAWTSMKSMFSMDSSDFKLSLAVMLPYGIYRSAGLALQITC